MFTNAFMKSNAINTYIEYRVLIKVRKILRSDSNHGTVPNNFPYRTPTY